MVEVKGSADARGRQEHRCALASDGLYRADHHSGRGVWSGPCRAATRTKVVAAHVHWRLEALRWAGHRERVAEGLRKSAGRSARSVAAARRAAL